MNVGLVSTWLHRGASYVTINYAKLLQPDHKVFIFGRGGEYFDDQLEIPEVNIHKGRRLDAEDGILGEELVQWIQTNKIEIVIWNEQRDLSALIYSKDKCPAVLHGAYIDYYKEDTVKWFGVYDFLICNTLRHYSVFKWHPQCFYLPWGCDTNLYMPMEKDEKDQKYKVVFFHSMGMANRKGTDILIRTFVNRNLAEYNVKLVIHTQTNIDSIITAEEAEKNNIEIVEQTVPAPGLYYRGDVYVYPAKLDGLGLTLYEAIGCGLPVIATNVAPMNEVIHKDNGYLVDVEKYYCRSDGYYWPLAEVSEESLYKGLMYFIENYKNLRMISESVRKEAEEKWELRDRKDKFDELIRKVHKVDTDEICQRYMSEYKKIVARKRRVAFTTLFIPKRLFALMKEKQTEKKFGLNGRKN